MDEILNKLKSKKILVPALICWVLVSAIYLIRTPLYDRTPDVGGHAKYTELIVTQKRMPLPYEDWLTYGPPLYYLINSFIFPDSVKSDPEQALHKYTVKALSIIYGIAFFLTIYWFLQFVTKNEFTKSLVTFFICTTPAVVFTFTTYNNDSLVILLSLLSCSLAYSLQKQFSLRNAILFVLISTLAFYTKTTFFWTAAALCLLSLTSNPILKKKLPAKNHIKIFFLILLSVCLHLPWLIFRNYHHTGKLFPFNNEAQLSTKLSPGIIFNNIRDRLTIPLIFEKERTWSDPFLHPLDVNHPSTKRTFYWSYSMISSILGEWVYQKPGIIIIWLLVLLHIATKIISLKEIFSSNITKLAGLAMVFIHSIQISHVIRLTDVRTFLGLGTSMSYRYIAWAYVCWAVLYATTLNKQSIWSQLLFRIIILGIITNIYFLVTVTGSEY